MSPQHRGQLVLGFVEALDQKRREEKAEARAEEQLGKALLHALAEVFCAPIQGPGGQGWTSHLVRERKDDVINERLIRLMRLNVSIEDRLDEAQGHEERMEVYEEAREMVKETAQSLTFWEALLMLSEASMAAPLNGEGYAEFGHCFARCYGLEQYYDLCGYSPLSAYDCEMFRHYCYNYRKHPWPTLDKQWIADFNERLQEYHEVQAAAQPGLQRVK